VAVAIGAVALGVCWLLQFFVRHTLPCALDVWSLELCVASCRSRCWCWRGRVWHQRHHRHPAIPVHVSLQRVLRGWRQ
jgi:hypothetical protein